MSQCPVKQSLAMQKLPQHTNSESITVKLMPNKSTTVTAVAITDNLTTSTASNECSNDSAEVLAQDPNNEVTAPLRRSSRSRTAPDFYGSTTERNRSGSK